MKQLIENLREQYLQHGTNHVQKAADLLEMLIAQRSETIEMTYAQAKTIEGLVVERDALKADADRYHWLIARMQASYDSAEHDVPGGFSVYCSMVSAWRTERIVRAEIKWEDKRDEQLGLSAAIDAALAALGETS